MCNCISKLESSLKDTIYKKKRILKASIVSAALLFPDLRAQTISNLELTLEGQNKIEKQNACHVYCPFCGEKYDPKK